MPKLLNIFRHFREFANRRFAEPIICANRLIYPRGFFRLWLHKYFGRCKHFESDPWVEIKRLPRCAYPDGRNKIALRRKRCQICGELKKTQIKAANKMGFYLDNPPKYGKLVPCSPKIPKKQDGPNCVRVRRKNMKTKIVPSKRWP